MGHLWLKILLAAICAIVLLWAGVVVAQEVSGAAPPTTRSARACARHVPQSLDDVAWENDRIAFRLFGPAALARPQQTGSGIDVWVKSTRAMVIDRWYASGDYRRDHGEGLDCYSVGAGRGCGGLGIWNGQSLDVSSVWKTHKIIEAGPQRAVIELTYAPWQSAGRKIWEHRRITLAAGSNLNRIESKLESDTPAELIVGIGLSKQSGEGDEAKLDRKRGILSYWMPEQPPNGHIACGVLVDPPSIVKLTQTREHFLALLRVIPGKPFVYYAGAGWSKGDFRTPQEWEEYLSGYQADFSVNAPP
jgi:hypothetical protein